MSTRRHTSRDLAQIAVFAGLIAALGLPGGIRLGSSPVMITFQTLGVMLAGAILGARKGAMAVLVFDLLVAAGLPLLSGSRGGLVWLTTAPSAGYLYGFVLGAWCIGYLTEKLRPQYPLWRAYLATAVGGMLAVYAIGVPVTALNTDLSLSAALLDSVKFWPGDLLKVVVTVLIAAQVHRSYPNLIAPHLHRHQTGSQKSDTHTGDVRT